MHDVLQILPKWWALKWRGHCFLMHPAFKIVIINDYAYDQGRNQDYTEDGG